MTRTRLAYVLEHRAVAERMLGRKLLRGEIVHHINGDPVDNRPENLVVMEHGEHVRFHQAKASAVYSPQELRELRLATGLSQETAARAIGITGKTIYRWENGLCRPRVRELRRLARFLEEAAA